MGGCGCVCAYVCVCMYVHMNILLCFSFFFLEYRIEVIWGMGRGVKEVGKAERRRE